MKQCNHLKSVISKLSFNGREAINEAISLALSFRNTEVKPEHLLLSIINQHASYFNNLNTNENSSISEIKTSIQNYLELNSSSDIISPVFSFELVQWLIDSWILASAHRSETEFGLGDLIETLFDNYNAIISDFNVIKSLISDFQNVHLILRNVTMPHSSNDTQKPLTIGVLDKYTKNLSELARMGQLDPVLGREKEIRQIVNILLRRRQNNPILTGEPGVGKTALAEGIAIYIAQGNVPPQLRGMEVLTLDLGLLQAGASVKGEFEKRLQDIINEISCANHPIILFIDEAHSLIGAGGQTGQNDAANLLKPVLARGELRVIAATTWKEYKKYFEKDAALARRFQVVKVTEPNIEAATMMMRTIAPLLSAYHGVQITERAIHASVVLSNRYIMDRQLPDKSSSLLDTACARVVVSQSHEPKDIESINLMLRALSDEYEGLKRENSNFERMCIIDKQKHDLQIKLSLLQEEWEHQLQLVKQISCCDDLAKADIIRKSLAQRHIRNAMVFDCVDETSIADVVSEWTGVPLGRMLEKEHQQIDALPQRLAERIIGQQYALEKITQQIRIGSAGLADPLKPTGVFLLAGPSGTGKTETSLALADILFGGQSHLITINMSEYQEAHSVSGLKGAPPGYVGYGNGGILTEAVRRNPYCVLLLDEIEKAHPDVMELFYQIFDKGTIEDSEGQIINFRNTLVIMTSNLASRQLVSAYNSGEHDPETLCSIIRPEFENVLTAALMGRITLLPYLPLQQCEIKSIVSMKLQKVIQRYLKVTNQQAAPLWDDKLVEWLANKCCLQQSGARDIDQVIDCYVLPLLATNLIQSNVRNIIKIHIDNNKVQLELDANKLNN
ncbi:type VI secretion system ATPase TssH [Hafnia paralvei]|uniref:type VI secretion system ATPase TssH n=1 Tax=Hafnia paralvei TaxID=546367 RepID=UPI000DF42627|nr:type VI secretion system ATPase TssH [Hafnia paralvei]RDA61914.1 type VI secretion system ATPase TssH [Hafnia paralvei]RDA62975.1 type VI secretion system ATPase TssH [Hafnia paralvei]RDA63815.1 type VI secretion system ATPase TssH [Hafnia paralvei]RDA75101.1 type VI secretion system ATPase TssH [Hafnia paralvei]RDA75505.1 type VI secretion system ATPase TssH [Hafnia paralvei]